MVLLCVRRKIKFVPIIGQEYVVKVAGSEVIAQYLKPIPNFDNYGYFVVNGKVYPRNFDRVQPTEAGFMEIGQKYQYLVEWRRQDPVTFTMCYRRSKELWAKVTAHMIRKKKYIFTDEQLLAEFKKYKTKKEIKESNQVVWLQASYHGEGFLKRCAAHMPENDKSCRLKYTLEELEQSAKKCGSKSEWSDKDRARCKAARNRGREFYLKCCAHMEKPLDKRNRLIYVWEFGDLVAYVGLTCNVTRRKRDHLAGGGVADHLKKTGASYEFKILQDGIADKSEASKAEESWRQKYVAAGWTMMNKDKCGSLGGNFRNNYTKEQIAEIFQKYGSNKELRAKNPTVARLAKKLGIYAEMSSHFVTGYPKGIKRGIRSEEAKRKTRETLALKRSQNQSVDILCN